MTSEFERELREARQQAAERARNVNDADRQQQLAAENLAARIRDQITREEVKFISPLIADFARAFFGNGNFNFTDNNQGSWYILANETTDLGHDGDKYRGVFGFRLGFSKASIVPVIPNQAPDSSYGKYGRQAISPFFVISHGFGSNSVNKRYQIVGRVDENYTRDLALNDAFSQSGGIARNWYYRDNVVANYDYQYSRAGVANAFRRAVHESPYYSLVYRRPAPSYERG